MKKTLFILGLLFLFIVLFVETNLIDDTINPNNLSKADIETNFKGLDNNFYLLLAVFEKPSVDIFSEDVLKKYYPFDKNGKFDANKEKAINNVLFKDYKYYKNAFKFHENHSLSHKRNWLSKALRSNEYETESISPNIKVLLERLDKIIKSGKYSEVRLTGMAYRYNRYIEKLFQIYLLNCLSEAVRKGEWKKNINNVLEALKWNIQVLKTSKSFWHYFSGYLMFRESSIVLNEFMNNVEFPKDSYEKVTSVLSFSEFNGNVSMKNAIVDRYLFFKNSLEEDQIYFEKNNPGIKGFIKNIFFRLDKNDSSPIFSFIGAMKNNFFQLNRSVNYLSSHYRKAIELLEKEPYLWNYEEIKLFDTEPLVKNFFWWFKNPTGKVKLVALLPYNNMVSLGHSVNAHYDLLKLSVLIHSKVKSYDELPRFIRDLKGSKLIDPFSGKSYKWNAKERLIYSVGNNRQDDKHLLNKKSDNYTDDILLRIVLSN